MKLADLLAHLGADRGELAVVDAIRVDAAGGLQSNGPKAIAGKRFMRRSPTFLDLLSER